MSEEKKKERIRRYRELARANGDPWIWGIFLTLVVLSIVESYSASSRQVAKFGVYGPLLTNLKHLGLGVLVAWGLSRVKYNNKWLLFGMIPVLWLFAMFGLVFVMFYGNVYNEAARSFTIPGIGLQVQPSEFAKLSAVTALAYILARNQKEKDVSNKGVIMCVALVTLFSAFIVTSSFTNTMLLMVISFTMLIVGGTKMKKVVYVALMYLVIGCCFMFINKMNDRRKEAISKAQTVQVDNASQADGKKRGNAGVDRTKMREGRIDRWLNYDNLIKKPVKDYDDNDKQSVFSMMAQAHGGLTGVGIGKSRECSRLPLAFSDYIFSIIVEETGLIGGMLVLMLYLWLLSRAAMITRRCHRVLPALLIIGMASMVTYQALFHIGINTGVFPVSGEPLPLVSHGGTSILVTCIAFGIMLSVSRTIYNDSSKSSRGSNELPLGLDAENPTEIPARNEWKSSNK